MLLSKSFKFESKFPLLFVEVLDVASILDLSLILVGLKQFDKVIFSLLSSFLFPLLSSVFSTIWASQLNSLFTNDIIRQAFLRFINYIKVAADKLFNRLINKVIIAMIDSLYTTVTQRDITCIVWFMWTVLDGILMHSDLQEKNWLSRKNEFVVNNRPII